MAKVMFGAGCFWGVEAKFRATPGVIEAFSGYAGGTYDNPTYKEVCADVTGHAEVVEVEYDPDKVAFEDLLAVFWDAHDPTQVNRQGYDFGTQYRTVIFTYDDDQHAKALASKQGLEASGKYNAPIATQIATAPKFWPAEDYHQRYLEKKGLVSCTIPGSG